MRLRLLVVSILLLLSFRPALADFYSRQWKKVYDLEVKDLPKSALEIVDKIYESARRDKNWMQLTRALLYQSKFARSEPDAELLIIQRWQKEIDNTGSPHRNVLQSLLAEMYLDYLDEHESKYDLRTRGNDSAGSDFRGWTAAAMHQKIAQLFQSSLENKTSLQGLLLPECRELLIVGQAASVTQPTLYDFLVRRALLYHQKRIPRYPIPLWAKDKSAFDDPSLFKIAGDVDSAVSRVWAFYTALYEFHKNDKDPTAFISLELDRIDFVTHHALMDSSEVYRLRRIAALSTKYRSHPASTLADARRAYLLDGQSKGSLIPSTQFIRRDALNICDDAIKRFPDSYGARSCRDLRDYILSPTLKLTHERFVPTRKSAYARIEYKNIDSIVFTAYPIAPADQEDFVGFNILTDSIKNARLAAIKPVSTWSAKLRNPVDYLEHSTEVIIPPLPPGAYVFVGATPDKQVQGVSILTVTNFAVIMMTDHEKYRYQVVDRTTGSPLPGARVVFYLKEKPWHTDTTDSSGFASTPEGLKANVSVMVSHRGDSALLDDYYNYSDLRSNSDEEDVIGRTVMFTDRSIYRPGQTVYFKGILFEKKGEVSKVVAGKFVEVSMEDANGKDIATLRLKTNKFGSFSGEFVLPQFALTGEFEIYADEDPEDEDEYFDKLDEFDYEPAWFQVEEYKRPTFEVKFNPVTETYKIRDSITMHGIASAFSGAKITSAKVEYTVERVTYWDWRWSRRYSGPNRIQISQGKVKTDENGEFKITFAAMPIESASRQAIRYYQYEVKADVMDVSGETRSVEGEVSVSTSGIMLDATVPEMIHRNKRNKFAVSVKNTNNADVASAGTLTIYKGIAPAAPYRSRPWGKPDLPIVDSLKFTSLFPHDDPHNRQDFTETLAGKVVATYPFSKSMDFDIKPQPTWTSGSYVAIFKTLGADGSEVTAVRQFRLVDLSSSAVPDNQTLVLDADKTFYHLGETINLTLGSAFTDATITIDITGDEGYWETRVERVSASQKVIQIPVKGILGKGLAIRAGMVHFNASFEKLLRISVVQETHSLQIATSSFTDKLQPGAPTTWSFTITGENHEAAEAEVLASMYDASLDQFNRHEWSYYDRPDVYNYSHVSDYASESFKTSNSRPMGQRNRTVRGYYSGKWEGLSDYVDWNWYGFSITNDRRVYLQYLDAIRARNSFGTLDSHARMYGSKAVKAGYVSGIVIDRDGEPLPGANIIVKGTIRGTVSDVTGRYEIKVSKDERLQFSFVGYNTLEVQVGTQNTVDVTLEEGRELLGEVLLSASYFTKEKMALGYAVTNVMARENDSDIGRLLQGKIPGVSVMSDSLGGAGNIMIRGYTSITGSKARLVIVDGVPVEKISLSPGEIAQMEVLDAKAARILYGEQGSNGALIITTKQGQKKVDEELAKVSARKKLNETAFFYPHLTTDASGAIHFTFESPESLTRWKLQLFAHNKSMDVGTKTLFAVTQKELMVTPNAPRFLRERDSLVFSIRIANLSKSAKQGNAMLSLTNPSDGASIDAPFKNNVKSKTFQIAAGGNAEVSWTLLVPEGHEAAQYKIVAIADQASDGEQNAIPILPSRTLVTESISAQVREGQSKTVSLSKLTSGPPAGAVNYQLTLEVTSNPGWYVIRSLPYLMEFPYECAEQLFSRYYGNALATSIANSTPRIKEVFDKWASAKSLGSTLEKNPELKSILIQETPWVREAESEAAQQKRLGLLFDMNAMSSSLSATIDKLSQLQRGDGGFGWFAGSPYSSRYITQHVVAGSGHLRHLKVEQPDEVDDLVEKAIGFLDKEIDFDYNYMRTHIPAGQNLAQYLELNHLSRTQIHYLYARSFFPEVPLSPGATTAVNYYRSLSEKYWTTYNHYMRGMIALVHHRLGHKEVSTSIMKSIAENSTTSDEMGMYWKEMPNGYYWYEAPIETQALLVEAFAEIQVDEPGLSKKDQEKRISDMQLWLIQQKKTNQWSTTKATTEAVNAMLLNGSDWLSVQDAVQAKVGSKSIQPPATAEAGTGYFKESWKGAEVKPAMGELKVSRKAPGVGWASLHWQYFQDLDKVTPASTPLKLLKKVYIVDRDAKGEVLNEIKAGGPVPLGSLLRVRVELKVDREMEFLHLKDMRAAGLEPVDVLSGYHWSGELPYYQSTRDAATHFFFDSAKPGVYVFEYDLRANVKGDFSNGFASIECMYAPEFKSHSQGMRIRIK